MYTKQGFVVIANNGQADFLFGPSKRLPDNCENITTNNLTFFYFRRQAQTVLERFYKGDGIAATGLARIKLVVATETSDLAYFKYTRCLILIAEIDCGTILFGRPCTQQRQQYWERVTTNGYLPYTSYAEARFAKGEAGRQWGWPTCPHRKILF